MDEAVIDMDELRNQITQDIITRSGRIARGIVVAGFVMACMMFLPAIINIFRHGDFIREFGLMAEIRMPLFFSIMNLLFFSAMAWVIYVRGLLVAKRGNFLVGRVLGPRRPFGSDMLSTDHGPTPVVSAGMAMAAGTHAFRNILPTELCGFEVVVNGRAHWFEMYLFGEEFPVVVGEDKILCYVDTGRFWFYPPSPYVVRCKEEEPQNRSRVESAIHALSSGARQPTKSDSTSLKHAAAKQLLGIGLVALVVTIGYIPVYMAFGWPMILFLCVVFAIPILIGLILHKSRG